MATFIKFEIVSPLPFLFSSTYSDIAVFERGFSILVWLISKLFNNPQFIIFIISVINIGLIVSTLKKYSESFPLSIYLFITTTLYYSAFNVMRQWIASAFLFWAIRYIINGNWKKYFLCVLIASTIHTSALIMIPFYFIAKSKPFGKKIMIFSVVIVSISILFLTFLTQFGGVLNGTRYENYTTMVEGDDGVNILRVLVSAIPVIISFIFYKKFNEDKDAKILINFSTINFLFYFLAMRATDVARFCIFFDLYNLLLYPKFLKIFNKKQNYLFIFLLSICFFVYMYLLLPVDSNLLPYRFFWNR